MTIEQLDKAIRRIPDFPKPGILFYDITSILANPEAFQFCLNEMISIYKDKNIDAVAGVESRGFVFGAPLAQALGIPLILIRKKGKLPGDTYKCSYALEYGTAEIEVQKADIKKGQKIVVIDDLIATGGTVEATCSLIEELGGEVACCAFLMELAGLNGREKLAKYDVKSVICYPGK